MLLAGAAPTVEVSVIEKAIHAALLEAHAVPPPIFVEKVAEIPKTAMGKAPLITVER